MLNTESFKQQGGWREWEGVRRKVHKNEECVEKLYGIFISCKTNRSNIKERYLIQLDNSVPIEVGIYTKFPMPDVGNLHGGEGPYKGP